MLCSERARLTRESQVEAACRALLELPLGSQRLGVRELAALLTVCPALLACRPAALHEQARMSPAPAHMPLCTHAILLVCLSC